METTETIRTAQEVYEISVPIVSSIKDAAKRFKEEGRIEDATFAEQLVIIMVTEVQIYEEMEKCEKDEESGALDTNEYLKAMDIIEEKHLLNMIALSELVETNKELYTEITGVKISNEDIDEMKRLKESF